MPWNFFLFHSYNCTVCCQAMAAPGAVLTGNREIHNVLRLTLFLICNKYQNILSGEAEYKVML